MHTTDILCDLTHYGLLKASGNDAKKLLQGQLTCDVEKLMPGNSCMGAHCNPQGRIISLFYLFQIQNDYYLLMPRSMISIALKALQKYAVFYKTALSDVSDDFLIEGRRDNHNDTVAAVVKLPSPSRRLLTVREKTTVSPSATTPIALISQNEWKRLDIHDGIPAIYPDTSGKFLPHELNLPALGAVSFDKGCYTGQEIIARMQYRGKLKTELCQATLVETTLPPLGSDIHFLVSPDKPSNGVLVDACQDETHHYYALIIMRK